MHGPSNGGNIFDLRRPLKVKGQGQTLKTLKSNISKTVRDREKSQLKLDRKSCTGFRMVKFFLPHVTSKGQKSRSNPKNFKDEYI